MLLKYLPLYVSLHAWQLDTACHWRRVDGQGCSSPETGCCPLPGQPWFNEVPDFVKSWLCKITSLLIHKVPDFVYQWTNYMQQWECADFYLRNSCVLSRFNCQFFWVIEWLLCVIDWTYSWLGVLVTIFVFFAAASAAFKHFCTQVVLAKLSCCFSYGLWASIQDYLYQEVR